MKRIRIVCRWGMAVSIVVLLLAGCGTPTPTPEPAPGMANPASVYCHGLGYEEETRTSDAGEYGVCLFPDGSECDSWGFLAGRCGQKYSYCVQQGYKLEAETDMNIGTCVFDDGSTCLEYEYFTGECQPGG